VPTGASTIIVFRFAVVIHTLTDAPAIAFTTSSS